MASYIYIKLYQESINKWKFEKKIQIGYLEFKSSASKFGSNKRKD